MPHTDFADVAGASALRAALITAGVPLPDGFDNAVVSGGWKVTLPDQPTTDAIAAASTQEDFDKASLKYADDLDRYNRVLAVRDLAEKTRFQVIVDAYHRARAEASPVVIDAFNTKAAEFTTIVESFPDVDVSDLSTDDFGKFAEARSLSDDLRRIHAAYNAIHGEPGKSGISADTGWFRIADCEDIDRLRAVIDHHTTNQANAYATLAPYYSVVRAGAGLRLITPAEAADVRQDAVERQIMQDQAAQAANPRQDPVNHAGLSQSATDRLTMNLRPVGR